MNSFYMSLCCCVCQKKESRNESALHNESNKDNKLQNYKSSGSMLDISGLKKKLTDCDDISGESLKLKHSITSIEEENIIDPTEYPKQNFSMGFHCFDFDMSEGNVSACSSNPAECFQLNHLTNLRDFDTETLKESFTGRSPVAAEDLKLNQHNKLYGFDNKILKSTIDCRPVPAEDLERNQHNKLHSFDTEILEKNITGYSTAPAEDLKLNQHNKPHSFDTEILKERDTGYSTFPAEDLKLNQHNKPHSFDTDILKERDTGYSTVPAEDLKLNQHNKPYSFDTKTLEKNIIGYSTVPAENLKLNQHNKPHSFDTKTLEKNSTVPAKNLELDQHNESHDIDAKRVVKNPPALFSRSSHGGEEFQHTKKETIFLCDHMFQLAESKVEPKVSKIISVIQKRDLTVLNANNFEAGEQVSMKSKLEAVNNTIQDDTANQAKACENSLPTNSGFEPIEKPTLKEDGEIECTCSFSSPSLDDSDKFTTAQELTSVSPNDQNFYSPNMSKTSKNVTFFSASGTNIHTIHTLSNSSKKSLQSINSYFSIESKETRRKRSLQRFSKCRLTSDKCTNTRHKTSYFDNDVSCQTFASTLSKNHNNSSSTSDTDSTYLSSDVLSNTTSSNNTESVSESDNNSKLVSSNIFMSKSSKAITTSSSYVSDSECSSECSTSKSSSLSSTGGTDSISSSNSFTPNQTKLIPEKKFQRASVKTSLIAPVKLNSILKVPGKIPTKQPTTVFFNKPPILKRKSIVTERRIVILPNTNSDTELSPAIEFGTETVKTKNEQKAIVEKIFIHHDSDLDKDRKIKDSIVETVKPMSSTLDGLKQSKSCSGSKLDKDKAKQIKPSRILSSSVFKKTKHPFVRAKAETGQIHKDVAKAETIVDINATDNLKRPENNIESDYLKNLIRLRAFKGINMVSKSNEFCTTSHSKSLQANDTSDIFDSKQVKELSAILNSIEAQGLSLNKWKNLDTCEVQPLFNNDKKDFRILNNPSKVDEQNTRGTKLSRVEKPNFSPVFDEESKASSQNSGNHKAVILVDSVIKSALESVVKPFEFLSEDEEEDNNLDQDHLSLFTQKCKEDFEIPFPEQQCVREENVSCKYKRTDHSQRLKPVSFEQVNDNENSTFLSKSFSSNVSNSPVNLGSSSMSVSPVIPTKSPLFGYHDTDKDKIQERFYSHHVNRKRSKSSNASSFFEEIRPKNEAPIVDQQRLTDDCKLSLFQSLKRKKSCKNSNRSHTNQDFNDKLLACETGDNVLILNDESSLKSYQVFPEEISSAFAELELKSQNQTLESNIQIDLLEKNENMETISSNSFSHVKNVFELGKDKALNLQNRVAKKNRYVNKQSSSIIPSLNKTIIDAFDTKKYSIQFKNALHNINKVAAAIKDDHHRSVQLKKNKMNQVTLSEKLDKNFHKSNGQSFLVELNKTKEKFISTIDFDQAPFEVSSNVDCGLALQNETFHQKQVVAPEKRFDLNVDQNNNLIECVCQDPESEKPIDDDKSIASYFTSNSPSTSHISNSKAGTIIGNNTLSPFAQLMECHTFDMVDKNMVDFDNFIIPNE